MVGNKHWTPGINRTSCSTWSIHEQPEDLPEEGHQKFEDVDLAWASCVCTVSILSRTGVTGMNCP